MESPPRGDLLITDADLVATVDDARREIPGGWVAITDGAVSGVGGPGDPRPDANRMKRLDGIEHSLQILQRHPGVLRHFFR